MDCSRGLLLLSLFVAACGPPRAAGSATPAPAGSRPAPDAASHGNCPVNMAALSGGTFQMGRRKDTVTVREFCLDATEVTVDAYAACVKAGACSSDKLRCDDQATFGASDKGIHPVNCVRWEQAKAYCAAQRKRLPTEEEWEWAARAQSNGWVYPWGILEPTARACARQGKTCPVGSYPDGDTPEGIHDLIGNVGEWTSSRFDAFDRVFRGGSSMDGEDHRLTAAYREGADPASSIPKIGFRCAWSASQPTAAREPDPPPSPFHVVAEGDDSLGIVPGSPTLLYGPVSAVEVRDSPSRPNPALLANLVGRVFFEGCCYYRADLLGGRWPDAAYAVVRDTSETLLCPSAILKWNGSQWARIASPGSRQTAFFAMSAWKDGHLFAGHEVGCGGVLSDDPKHENAPGIRLYSTTGRAPRPSPGEPGTACRTRMREARALATLPTGEVFLGGSECGAPSGAAVEVWQPNGTAQFHRLASESTVNAVVARSPTEAYASIADGGLLYRFDGSKWQTEPVPFSADIVGMAGDSNSLWVVLGNGEVWTHAKGTSWQTVTMPEGHRPLRIWIPAESDVWITTRKGMIRTGPRRPPFTMPETANRLPSESLPQATPDCGLFTLLTDQQGDEQGPEHSSDARRLARVVRGHTELKHTAFAESENTVLVAVSSDYGEAVRLAAILRKGLPGHPIRMVCGLPRFSGPLSIDIARGVVVPAIPPGRKAKFEPE